MVSDIVSGLALVSFDFDGERVTAAMARYPDGSSKVVKGNAARTVYRLVCEHNAKVRGRRSSTEVLEVPVFELHEAPQVEEVPVAAPQVERSWLDRTVGYLYRIFAGTSFEDAAAGLL